MPPGQLGLGAFFYKLLTWLPDRLVLVCPSHVDSSNFVFVLVHEWFYFFLYHKFLVPMPYYAIYCMYVHSHLTCTYYGRVKPRICESHRERKYSKVGCLLVSHSIILAHHVLLLSCTTVRAACEHVYTRYQGLIKLHPGLHSVFYFAETPRGGGMHCTLEVFFLNSARPPCISFCLGLSGDDLGERAEMGGGMRGRLVF